MHGAISTRDNWVTVGACIPFTEVEDESRTDEHLEEHDEWDAQVRVPLLENNSKQDGACARTTSGEATYRNALPETHDDGTGNQVPIFIVDVSRSVSRSARSVSCDSHKEVAETIAGQNVHEPVHSEAPSLLGIPVALQVLDEYACCQEEENEFETEKGNKDVHKVAIDARKDAITHCGAETVHRWLSCVSPGVDTWKSGQTFERTAWSDVSPDDERNRGDLAGE